MRKEPIIVLDSEEEALKAVEQGPERVQLTAFLKVRADLLFQFV